MIARTSIRWRLVAWVTGVLLSCAGVIFVVVYEQTGHELRSQIDHDITGDVSQLSQAIKTMHSSDPETLLSDFREGLQQFGERTEAA